MTPDAPGAQPADNSLIAEWGADEKPDQRTPRPTGYQPAPMNRKGTLVSQDPEASCDARYHGTTTAYQKHHCRCTSALAAWRRYRKHREAGIQPPGMIDATGTHRRIQAMQLMGHSQAVIAARAGLGTKDAVAKILARPRVYPRTARAIEAVCAELGMRTGTSANTVTLARRKGWVSLLAWNNIDDPRDVPHTGEQVSDDGEVDFAAVDQALHGQLAYRDLRTPDRLEAVALLWRDGRSMDSTADLLGTTKTSIEADRQRLRYLARKSRAAA